MSGSMEVSWFVQKRYSDILKIDTVWNDNEVFYWTINDGNNNILKIDKKYLNRSKSDYFIKDFEYKNYILSVLTHLKDL